MQTKRQKQEKAYRNLKIQEEIELLKVPDRNHFYIPHYRLAVIQEQLRNLERKGVNAIQNK